MSRDYNVIKKRKADCMKGGERMPTSRAGTWSSRAFTLIELVVVLFILALLVSLVMPRIGTLLSHGDTNKAIRQIRGMARYLAGMAVSTRTPYLLYYDLKEGTCWVGRPNEQGEIIKEQEMLTRPLHLPSGVRFIDISTPRGVQMQGVAYTEFSPTGWVEETLIHIGGGRAVTIQLLPLTGDIKVYEGYVEIVEG
jgi:prepilin-type N-terminal cleavage/methylation domain-containing protein